MVLAYAITFEVIHNNFHILRIDIPIAVPTMLGTIISLLLAFKSNQAYDRWWEARIVWGAIVNDSRTLMRQIIYYNPNTDDDFGPLLNFAKRQSAWCYALAQSLRDLDSAPILLNLLSKEEFKYVEQHDHKPNALLMLHADYVRDATRKGTYTVYQQVEIDNTLTRLCDSMGKCERIKKTVFPTTYSTYNRFTLCIFVLLLPFGLTEHLNWLQIPVVTIIGTVFFLIEKMAIHLQDPFEGRPTDTPMILISNNIEKNLMQMVIEYCDDQVLKDANGNFEPTHSEDAAHYYVL